MTEAPAVVLARAVRRAKNDGLELALLAQIRAARLPEPVRELRFHTVRRWRFDLAWPSLKIAVEVDGGAWSGGRHVRGPGYEKDCEKLAEAAIMGWAVLRVTGGHIERGQAIDWINRLHKSIG